MAVTVSAPVLALLPESASTYTLDKNASIVQTIAKGSALRFGITVCAARDASAVWILYDTEDDTADLRKVNAATGVTLATVHVPFLIGTRDFTAPKCLVAGVCGRLITTERATGQLV